MYIVHNCVSYSASYWSNKSQVTPIRWMQLCSSIYLELQATIYSFPKALGLFEKGILYSPLKGYYIILYMLTTILKNNEKSIVKELSNVKFYHPIP